MLWWVMLSLPGLTHETSGEVKVSADLAIDLHLLLHANGIGLCLGQSILETIS